MAKLPKPEGIKSQPRFKQKGTPKLPKGPFENLRKLSNAEAHYKHSEEFQKQARAERNDRGAAILLAANVENALETALVQNLRPGKIQKLFNARAPLGDFSGKILMGYSLGIYGDEMFNNLEIIRAVRNAFAHAKIPIDFSSKEIVEVCNLFVVPKILPPHVVGAEKEKLENLKVRERYQKICERISHNLIWQVIVKTEIHRNALVFPLDDTLEIFCRRKPLP